MSIQYREKTLPFDVYNADYTQFNDYHHSFNIAPRTSLLRFTISPGQHVFNNLDYSNLMLNDSRYIPLEQSIFLAYDPRIKYFKKTPKNGPLQQLQRCDCNDLRSCFWCGFVGGFFSRSSVLCVKKGSLYTSLVHLVHSCRVNFYQIGALSILNLNAGRE